MRRIQFIEIHEQPWLPSAIRDGITDAIRFAMNLLHAYTPIVPQLQSALDATNSLSIIDLCSGGGGPWRDLARKLHGNPGTLQILLTDKYPNHGAAEDTPDDVTNHLVNHLNFFPRSVDAKKVPFELKGLRTMFTSFHHFPPEEARAILQNAVDAREGIGIFEITRRAPATIVLMFAVVGILFVCTPWIRPFRWSRLLWTYLVPILPVVLLLDGVVSCLRTYRPQELREMVGRLSENEYRWEIDEQSTGKTPVTFLIGLPNN